MESFQLKRDSIMKIIEKKDKTKYDNSVFTKFSELKKKVSVKQKKDGFSFSDIFKNKDIVNLSVTNYLRLINNINTNLGTISAGNTEETSIISKMDSNDQTKYTIKDNIKFTNIITTMYSPEIHQEYHNKDSCGRELFVKKHILIRCSVLYDCLELHGSYLYSVFNWCEKDTIDILYLMLFLFNSVTIFDGIYIYCNDFNPSISHTTFKKIIKSDFYIDNKQNYNELLKYLKVVYTGKINVFNTYNRGDIEEYRNILYTDTINRLLEVNDLDKDNIKVFYKYVFEKYKQSYNNNKKQLKKVHSSIKKIEGDYLTSTIKTHKYKKCLEIGMAFGISAMYILTASDNVTLTSIDPFQKTQWENMGIKLLRNIGVGKNHKLIEEKSYIGLPQLLKRNELSYDMIFIDGWHTFDYTLIDFFYSDKLLKVGGRIIIDDALHKGVQKCVNYLVTNYSDFYIKLKSPITIAAFKKIKEDPREWNYHTNF